MVARLRRLREKREEREPAAAPRASQSRTSVTARFSAGDRIFCMPWGYGKVRASQIDSERELLLVEFPDHGELTVDPAVSAVRLVNEEKDEE